MNKLILIGLGGLAWHVGDDPNYTFKIWHLGGLAVAILFIQLLSFVFNRVRG